MTSVTARVAGRLALVAASITCLAGCPNVVGELEDFEARDQSTETPPPKVECGTATDNVEGQFLFALATDLGPDTPLLFLTDITTGADGLTFSVTPLSKADRKTPVGDAVVLSAYPIDAEKGTFEADLPLLKVPGTANPISDAEIEADVALSGAVCEDALCGSVSGQVLKPIEYTLNSKKSSFYMERIDGGPLPELPFVNCAKEQAAPLE